MQQGEEKLNKIKFLLYTIVGVTLFLSSAQAIELGDNIPMKTQKMKNVDGKELSIQGVQGTKGTLVIFSCNSCPWVKAWESRIVAIGNEYQQKGIGVIAINSNDPKVKSEDSYAQMQQVAKSNGYEFPYVVDVTSDVARAFDATRTPEAFLFNSAGKLVYHGTIDDNARDSKKVEDHYLRDALDALLAGKEIQEPETKSLGCSIKFR